MALGTAARDLLGAYLAPFDGLAGDRRARALVGATVRGSIASESLVCSRIAAFSPCAGGDGARGAAGSAHGAG